RCLLALVVLLAALYGGEDIVLRYRISHNQSAAVFDQVPVYEAGEVKGGKLEYYFDQGQMQVCVHAMFPHFGSAPCWYVTRHREQRITQALPGRLPDALPSPLPDAQPDPSSRAAAAGALIR
ncbi:MAG TPA: hypothetical protein VKG84_01640, partial [Candidatus Acidoferrales bacterium]|nr:hypothetical protein [Candidatus Acidoferrales bacterium]